MPQQIKNNITENLLRISLLGTQQFKPDETLEAFWEEHGIVEEQLEHLLLHSAALQHLWQKTKEKPVYSQLTQMAPAPTEKGSICGFQTVEHLKAILDGRYAEALPEFIQLATENGRILPPQFLPELLDESLQTPEMWSTLEPIIGQRAYWLLEQHPQWQRLVTPPSDEPKWQTKNKAVLNMAFSIRRTMQPTEARKELQALWPTLKPNEKAKLTAVLEVNLSDKDEKFLENCLNESRKEVRLAAAQLLYNLPDSALIHRLFNIAKSAVQLVKGKIELQLPEELPEQTKKDGIYPTGTKVKGGLRLNWLIQILEKVPFVLWQEHFNCTSEVLLAAWQKCTDADVVIPAIAASLLRHPLEDVVEPFCVLLVAHNAQGYWQHDSCEKMLLTAPKSTFYTIIQRWLEVHGPLIPDGTIIDYWLRNSTYAWNIPLSKIIIKGFLTWIEESGSKHWHIYHYKLILKKAAYQADSSLFEEIKAGISFQYNRLGSWAIDAEKLLEIMHFRVKMKAGLLAD